MVDDRKKTVGKKIFLLPKLSNFLNFTKEFVVQRAEIIHNLLS